MYRKGIEIILTHGSLTCKQVTLAQKNGANLPPHLCPWHSSHIWSSSTYGFTSTWISKYDKQMKSKDKLTNRGARKIQSVRRNKGLLIYRTYIVGTFKKHIIEDKLEKKIEVI